MKPRKLIITFLHAAGFPVACNQAGTIHLDQAAANARAAAEDIKDNQPAFGWTGSWLELACP